jgi:hypothetical protein
VYIIPPSRLHATLFDSPSEVIGLARSISANDASQTSPELFNCTVARVLEFRGVETRVASVRAARRR